MARGPQPMQQDGGPGAPQRATSKFIVFDHIEKMNTKSQRTSLAEKEAAWIENLQVVAPNNLAVVPAPLPPLTTIAGQTTLSQFMATIGTVDYIVVFTTAGAGYVVSTLGAVTQFAPAGTFANPDATTYASQRILIADSKAGYCSWDGTVFVKQGGVSPHIVITNGGSGYTSAPGVTLTGGSGTGFVAVATISGGSVVSITVISPGTGFLDSDTLTVVFTGGGGSGAAATAIVWPTVAATTLAVFAGRVWFGNGRILQWTGTEGFDDTNPANAAGSTTISDADLSHEITALRNLNNYLFIFGDSSIRQIGSISVSSGVTLFTPLTLDSDVGCPFPRTIQSYNRLVLFAAKTGVYAIFGASVEKISDDLDGIFEATDFSLTPCAAINDIRNIHCYLLLLRYLDPVAGARSIICVFQSKLWFVVSQGDSLLAITSAPLASNQVATFGSSGSDVTQLLASASSPIAITLRTALTPHGNSLQAKMPLKGGMGANVFGFNTITFDVDTEGPSQSYQLNVQPSNASNFQFPYTAVEGYGKFLGVTITATVENFALNLLALEYQDADLWGSPVILPPSAASGVLSTGTFTLSANATSTAVGAPACTSSSIVIYVPITPDGANDMATTSVVPGTGAFTLTHANNARTDRTFAYAVIGTTAPQTNFIPTIGQFTLAANAISTTITSLLCTPSSLILYAPITPDGANDMATTSVVPGTGAFTLTHANNSRSDRTFSYVLIGGTLAVFSVKASGTFTLNANATTTVVSSPFCTPSSVVLYDPVTPHGANDMATTSVVAGGGVFTLTHANNARADRTFRYVVIGI